MADDFDDLTRGAVLAPPAPPVWVDAVGEALTLVESALKLAVDVPAAILAEEAAQAHLTTALLVRAGVEELTARLVRTVSDRGLPRLAGASSTRAWLTSVHGLSAADASRLVRESRAHPGDPDGVGRDARSEPTRLAWAGGALSAERAVVVADTLAKIGRELPVEATDALQAELVSQSPTLGYTEFRYLCAHALEVLDPDGADAQLEAQPAAEEERALQSASLTFHRVGDGTTRFNGLLPDLQADVFRAALEGYSSPRHRRRTSPDNPYLRIREDDGSDELTYPRRLGRALAELLEHLPTSGLPQHGVNPATVVVTITTDQLTGALGEASLDTGTTLSAGQARRLACNAWLVPAVLGGGSQVLDLGTSSACSAGRSGSRSPSATAAASGPAATGDRLGAKPITSSPGAAAAAPT